jgi:hypothetical protein
MLTFTLKQNMEFRFAEEEDGAEYATRLAAGAERYAPAHAVAGEWLLTRCAFATRFLRLLLFL